MHLRPVQQEDLPAFADLLARLMHADNVTPYIAPKDKQYPDSFYHRALRNTKRKWYDGNFLLLCVSDPSDADWTGEEIVLGYCAYSTNLPTVQKPAPGGWLGNAFECWALRMHSWYVDSFGLDQSGDLAALRHFREALNDETVFTEFYKTRSEAKNLKEELGSDGQPFHWELTVLGTHPEYRRRGIGRMMLEWGFAWARETDTPLIVSSTPEGKLLYLNAGFREVGEAKMVPGPYGAKGQKQSPKSLEALDLGLGVGKGIVVPAMVWEP